MGELIIFLKNVKGLRYFPTLLRLKPLSYIQALCHPDVTTLIVQKTHKFEMALLNNYVENFTYALAEIQQLLVLLGFAAGQMWRRGHRFTSDPVHSC